MRTSDLSWTASAKLRRVVWLAHAGSIEFKLGQFADAVGTKFDPNQPRVPAGNPDGGEWTSTGGGTAASGQNVQVAGGFTDDQIGLTVQSFISAHCQGSIHSILPGQFYEMTIAEVMAAAKTGDAAARRCLKLLGRDDYRK